MIIKITHTQQSCLFYPGHFSFKMQQDSSAKIQGQSSRQADGKKFPLKSIKRFAQIILKLQSHHHHLSPVHKKTYHLRFIGWRKKCRNMYIHAHVYVFMFNLSYIFNALYDALMTLLERYQHVSRESFILLIRFKSKPFLPRR